MAFLLAWALVASAWASSVDRDPANLGTPFSRYTTIDTHQRRITFYLSQGPDDKPQPLAVFIQGSGCDSVFRGSGDHVSGGYQSVLLKAGNGRIRAMAVEKPGVRYLDVSQRPGSATGCSQEFLEQHTLSLWADAVNAAIEGSLTLPGIDASRVLVIGHSEGGIIAARVAASNPKVTHVAVLSGGGPTQLFGLAAVSNPDIVYQAWAEIQKDPQNATRFFMGHPYRRWSSFLGSSTIQELLRSEARVYAAQGTRDTTVPIVELDFLRAELGARNRAVVIDRVEGGDHALNREGESSPTGMARVLGRIVEWALQ